jgi:hypothetical protein
MLVHRSVTLPLSVFLRHQIVVLILQVPLFQFLTFCIVLKFLNPSLGYFDVCITFGLVWSCSIIVRFARSSTSFPQEGGPQEPQTLFFSFPLPPFHSSDPSMSFICGFQLGFDFHLLSIREMLPQLSCQFRRRCIGRF